MLSSDTDAYKRGQKKFSDTKPGDRFNFMGEWYEAVEYIGLKAGMILKDQQDPRGSEPSPLAFVFPCYSFPVTVVL